MSFGRGGRGNGGGGFRGRGGNGGNRGGGYRGDSRGGSRGGSRGSFGDRFNTSGPPQRVIPLGNFIYTCQDDLICKVEIDDVPYFNAPIYLENKEQVGKIDEIFGTIRDYSVSVKLSDNMNANSFKQNQKLFIDPGKLLPISRFLPKPPQLKTSKKKGVSGGGVGSSYSRGGNRGGFSGGRGGRGGGGFKGRGGSGDASRGGGFNKGRGGFNRGNSSRNRW